LAETVDARLAAHSFEYACRTAVRYREAMPRLVENLLSPSLDWYEIRDAFRKNTYTIVDDLMQAEAAEVIYECLQTDVPWEAAYREKGVDKSVPVSELAKLSPDQQNQLHQNVIKEASEDYQFFFLRYPMIDAYVAGRDPGLLLHKLTEFLNSEHFLNFVRYITDDDGIRKSEAMATLYEPGHFLKNHDDLQYFDNEDRRCACVLQLSKDWVPDWGGNLIFTSGSEHEFGITPKFNQFAIFRVPHDHHVSYVAPYATKPRYTITVFLRAD